MNRGVVIRGPVLRVVPAAETGGFKLVRVTDAVADLVLGFLPDGFGPWAVLCGRLGGSLRALGSAADEQAFLSVGRLAVPGM